MNCGSIGEIPPSTWGRTPFSKRIARDARIVMSAKIRQSGSQSTKSQWDLLLGSFHNITASITPASIAVPCGRLRATSIPRVQSDSGSAVLSRAGPLERQLITEQHRLAPVAQSSRILTGRAEIQQCLPARVAGYHGPAPRRL